MNNLTLKQIRAVESLSRHQHFGRAAESLSISQPALSLQIKELEDMLGASLFERGTRHVKLTGFGEDFLKRAQPILRSVDDLSDLARAMESNRLGRLRIGIIPTIAPYLLPRIIRELTAHYPEIDLHIRETVTSKLLQDMGDGRLDTAIIALPVSEPAFVEVPLFDEQFVLVQPYSDSSKPAPDVKDLREMRLLLLEEGHCFRDQALAFCDLNVARPREMLEGSSLSTLVQMVSAGIGVTLIPEMAIDVETKSANVVITRFKTSSPSRRIGMIWRKTTPLADQMAAIADLMRQSARLNRTP
jgi:LysR family hydrogen peroxide-inducible transcriptional activator